MFRALLLSVAFAPAALFAQFPPALTSRIAVTATAYGGAPDSQFEPMISAAGDMALVVWRDSRRGTYSIFAARVSAEGRVLDTVGILVADGAFPEAVVTDGDVFRILLLARGSRHILTIDREGTIVGDRTLDAALSRGQCVASRSIPSARFLLWTTDTAGTSATIIDGEGNVTARQVLFPTAYNGWVIGASRGSEYLLLIPFSRLSGPSDYLALRVADDARLLSATLTGVSGFNSSDLLAGGADGYLLVKQPDYTRPTTISTYKLDENGVFTGVAPVFTDPDPNDQRPKGARHLEWAGDRYLLTVTTGPQTGHSFTEVGELRNDSWRTRTLFDWVGVARDGVSARVGDRNLVVTSVNQLYTSSNFDLYVQTQSENSTTGPLLVTGSATLQTNARIAAGDNGYLMGWSENGPDRLARTLVRRFSAAGVPQGDAIAIREGEQTFSYPTLSTDLRLASNGETYVVVFWKEGWICARRMRAATGEWLDDDPVKIAQGGQAEVASNGRDAVIVYSSFHGLSVRRIALAGDASLSSAVGLSSSQDVYSPAIGSDGNDYLVAWSEGFRSCPFECVYGPFKLLALRLRGDATRLDATPLHFDDNGFADLPAISFAGEHYLVTWNDGGLLGAYVTREGAISESALLDASTDLAAPAIAAVVNNRFVLLERHRTGSDTVVNSNWTAATFGASLSLDRVAAIPRTSVTTGPGEGYLSLWAVGRGDVLALAYDEPADSTKGSVNRVFLRFFGDLQKRRSAGP